MDLHARIDAMEAELVALRAQVGGGAAARPAAATPDEPTTTTPGEPPERSTRRRLLGTAGAAAVGAAAGLVASASPAAANDPNDVTLGATKTTAARTQVNIIPPLQGVAVLFQAGTLYSGTDTAVDAALGGWVTPGYTFARRYGVYGYAEHAANGAGVYAHALGLSVAGLEANSFNGPTMRLVAGLDAPTAVPPPVGDWAQGDVLRTADAELWYCRVGGYGAASVWTRLSGGGLNLLPTPQRAFDTRPGAGPFEGNDTRTISLAEWGVPAGARGALLNVTATDTTGAGYVQVYSAALSSPPATSNLNWYESGQIVANNATTAVDASARIKITTQGGIAAIIVDVFGFYW